MATDLHPIVSKNLAFLRKKKGLTQGALSERFSYSDKTISKWEKGDALPDLETLKELADFYEVPLDYFVQEHDEENEKIPVNPSSKTVVRNSVISTLLALFSVISLFAVLDCVFRINPIKGWNSYQFYFWMMPVLAIVLFSCAKHFKWDVTAITSLILFFWLLAAATYLELGYDLGKDGWACSFVLFIPVPLTALFLFRFFSKRTRGRVSLPNEEEIH